jgi:hypothetical protein
MRLCSHLRFPAVALAVALAQVAAAPARACSQAPGGLIPSNYELERGSPAIVLARAVRFQEAPENPGWGDVGFEIEEVVAGDVRAGSLTLYGNLQFAGRSPDADFSTARPGAFAGGCMADDYRLGHRYLLFLRQHGRRWNLAGPSFSRVNEEVDGPEAPWVQTVRLYVHVTALHGYDQEKAALRRLRARAAAGKEPRAPAAALVADIDRHFATPGDAKSGPDLLDLFRKASDDGVRFQAVWALAHGASPEMKGFMRQLLAGETRAEWLTALGTYFELVPDPAAFASLAGIYVRYPPDAPQRRAIVDGLQAAAGSGDLQRLLELLRGSSASEASSLAFAFARHGRDPRPAIADLHRRITAKNAYTRDLSLALTLAVLGDAAVVEWAERVVAPESPGSDDAGSPGSPGSEDAGSASLSALSNPGRASESDRWTAACVLAVSPLAAADSAAREHRRRRSRAPRQLHPGFRLPACPSQPAPLGPAGGRPQAACPQRHRAGNAGAAAAVHARLGHPGRQGDGGPAARPGGGRGRRRGAGRRAEAVAG